MAEAKTYLDPELKKKAKQKAQKMGVSLAAYLRKILIKDLQIS